MMTERRVVITGLGSVSPVGNDVKTMWDNIIAGQSGIDFITRVNKDDFPVHVAAEIKDFDAGKYISKRDLRKMDLFTQYARSEEHTSELQSRGHLVCRLLLEKKKNT